MSGSLSNLIEFLVSLIQTLFVSMVMVGTVAITLQMLYTTLLLEVYFVLQVASSQKAFCLGQNLQK